MVVFVKRKPHYEATLRSQLVDTIGCPEPTMEYQFARPRKWRFDLAWPKLMIAVEIHGSIWTRGRHVRGRGFQKDREKMRAAVKKGWRVLEYTADEVQTWEAAQEIASLVLGREVRIG